MKLFATIKDNIGVILIFIGVLAGYVLLTDVFHVLNPFLFYSITVIPPLFSEYFGMLIEGLKSSLSLLIWAYMLALISASASARSSAPKADTQERSALHQRLQRDSGHAPHALRD